MYSKKIIFLLFLLALISSEAFADCGIVTREQHIEFLPTVSKDAYVSGFFLGCSLVLFLLSAAYYVYRTNSYVLPALTTVLFLAIAAVLFLIDVTLGSECGILFGASGYLPNLSLFFITILLAGIHFWLSFRPKHGRN